MAKSMMSFYRAFLMYVMWNQLYETTQNVSNENPTYIIIFIWIAARLITERIFLNSWGNIWTPVSKGLLITSWVLKSASAGRKHELEIYSFANPHKVIINSTLSEKVSNLNYQLIFEFYRSSTVKPHMTKRTKSMIKIIVMTSTNGNIFRVTGHLCEEFTGPRWIPHTKASDAELWCLLWSAPE